MKKLSRSPFIIFALCFFCMITVGCAKKNVINGVEEKEANEILVILASRDVIAEKNLVPVISKQLAIIFIGVIKSSM